MCPFGGPSRSKAAPLGLGSITWLPTLNPHPPNQKPTGKQVSDADLKRESERDYYKKKTELSTITSGILMMRCCRPHLRYYAAAACSALSRHVLPVATLSPCSACDGSHRRIQPFSQKWSQRSVALVRAGLEVNPQPSPRRRGFWAAVPPADRNLRSWQECAQISMRRQVCSARPHSSARLQLFVCLSLSGATFNTRLVVTPRREVFPTLNAG